MRTTTLREFRQKLGLYTIGDAARCLGITYKTLYYAVNAGYCPPPTRGDGTRKYYSEEDVNELKRKISK